MIYIKSLTVSVPDTVSPVLEWEYTNPKASLTGYKLEVYRSEAPAPITNFSGIDMDVSPSVYSYTDTTLSGLMSYQYGTMYYRIKVVDIDTPTTYEWSNPAHVQVLPDLQAKKMLRHKSAGIKKYGTIIKIVKKRKADGIQCECFDEVLQRSTDDECALCNGTGIATTGGYYDPIEVKVAINMKPKQNQITPFGIWQDKDAMIDMLNYPIMEPDDLIVDQRNQRYKIRQVAPYYKGQALVSQRCVMVLQDKTSQVYDVEV